MRKNKSISRAAERRRYKTTFLPILSLLEKRLGYEPMSYVIRSLYGQVFIAASLKETKAQLQARIKRFEKEECLPEVLSVTPIDQLLQELEDARQFYLVGEKSIDFSCFK